MQLCGRPATKLEVELGRKLCDYQDKYIVARQRIKELEAEKKRSRKLLHDALPHIECKNNSQSGLITEIGEYLSKALEGNKGKGNEDGKDADSCIA